VAAALALCHDLAGDEGAMIQGRRGTAPFLMQDQQPSVIVHNASVANGSGSILTVHGKSQNHIFSH